MTNTEAKQFVKYVLVSIFSHRVLVYDYQAIKSPNSDFQSLRVIFPVLFVAAGFAMFTAFQSAPVPCDVSPDAAVKELL